MFSHARTKTRTRAIKLKSHYADVETYKNAVSMILVYHDVFIRSYYEQLKINSDVFISKIYTK